MSDVIDHPQHYTAGKVECIHAIEAATEGLKGFEGYATGNCMKYLYRWKKKGGLTDLKKCLWYLNKLIETLEESK